MFDEFKNYLIETKKREANTAKFYIQDVRQLKAYFSGRDIVTLTTTDIQDYINALTAKYKPCTVCRKIASLSTFYKWAVIAKYCDCSPIYHLNTPGRPRNVRVPAVTPLPRVCLVPEVLDKVQGAIWSDNNFIRLRDQAMYGLMMFCGIRASEVQMAIIDDVNVEYSTITIHRLKRISGSPREITVDMGTSSSAVVAYLHQRLAQFPKVPDPALFVNIHGNRISVRSIRRKLGYYASVAGIKLNPTNLVHNFALQSLKTGISLTDLHKRLGHSSVLTTREYISHLGIIGGEPSK